MTLEGQPAPAATEEDSPLAALLAGPVRGGGAPPARPAEEGAPPNPGRRSLLGVLGLAAAAAGGIVAGRVSRRPSAGMPQRYPDWAVTRLKDGIIEYVPLEARRRGRTLLRDPKNPASLLDAKDGFYPAGSVRVWPDGTAVVTVPRFNTGSLDPMHGTLAGEAPFPYIGDTRIAVPTLEHGMQMVKHPGTAPIATQEPDGWWYIEQDGVRHHYTTREAAEHDQAGLGWNMTDKNAGWVLETIHGSTTRDPHTDFVITKQMERPMGFLVAWQADRNQWGGVSYVRPLTSRERPELTLAQAKEYASQPISKSLIYWARETVDGILGAQIRVVDGQGRELHNVTAACPEEGWLEVIALDPYGQAVMDRSTHQLTKLRVRTSFTLIDRRDATVLHRVWWPLTSSARMIHEDLRGKGVHLPEPEPELETSSSSIFVRASVLGQSGTTIQIR